jgi:hypothetical protein
LWYSYKSSKDKTSHYKTSQATKLPKYKTSQAPKVPTIKRPNLKTSQLQNIPATKRPKPQNFLTPKYSNPKTSQASKHPKPQNAPTIKRLNYKTSQISYIYSFQIRNFNNVHKLFMYSSVFFLEYVSKPNNASKSTVNRTLPAIEILAL